ncbi:MAG: Gfo/Idh/MocA family oxidoreductase, partial [Chloroflexota bacterium]|nr:Gfo/Idh/MocA family oxidoreductase [Chloroflexota bacterium]
MGLKVGIIGCGLIGARRAGAVRDAGDDLVVASDVVVDRAIALAETLRADCTSDWADVVQRPDLDAVVVSTSNDLTAEASIAALQSGKHVLCEKPMGRNGPEARAIAAAQETSGLVLKVGFNHRFHPAIAAAEKMTSSGAIGEPYMMRAVYGHGGRAGYEREWRADAARSGGGELLDQGVHIVDLAQWFLGPIVDVQGAIEAFHWLTPVEDNAFALMRTDAGRIASMHTSWTQWRNTFRFEVLGHDGFLRVDGLGGSYGTERLTFAKRNEDSSPPVEDLTEFPGPD